MNIEKGKTLRIIFLQCPPCLLPCVGCCFGVACLGPFLRLCCSTSEWCIKAEDSLFTSRALISGKFEWNWYMHMTCTLMPNVFIVISAITMNTKGIREWLALLSICYGLFKKVKHKISCGLQSGVSFAQWRWPQAFDFCELGGFREVSHAKCYSTLS